ncbi:hypothetical protein DFH27DRAFT_634026 [Peziza echinospora]|nr:hypothetical protein DFH27DRAFT_634026 [Peziza echinospora]
MASHLDKNDQRALEAARMRFANITNTLSSFHSALVHNEQLIPWPNQQAQFAILSSNLESLSKTLSTHFPTLPPATSSSSSSQTPHQQQQQQQQAATHDALVAYPNPTFPAREQETMIGMLMRKKLQPPIEEWVHAGRQLGEAGLHPSWPTHDTSYLWNAAAQAVRELNEERDWDDAYTMEEREEGIELVQTGLSAEMMEVGSLDEKGKRKTGGGGGGAGVGGTGAAGAGAGAGDGGLKIEAFYKFWSTGVLPQAYGR